jgi:hypothetical protein
VTLGVGGRGLLVARPVAVARKRLVQDLEARVQNRGAQTVEVSQLVLARTAQRGEEVLRGGRRQNPSP